MRPRVLLASFASTAMTATGGLAVATSTGAFAAEAPPDGPPLTVVQQRVVVDPAAPAPAPGSAVDVPAVVPTTSPAAPVLDPPGASVPATVPATVAPSGPVAAASGLHAVTPTTAVEVRGTAPAGGPPVAPTTTAPPTTTWPPGTEIDDDWTGPIPPIPPGCREPELEDDGEWECDD